MLCQDPAIRYGGFDLWVLNASVTARVISRWWNDVNKISVSAVAETRVPGGNHEPTVSRSLQVQTIKKELPHGNILEHVHFLNEKNKSTGMSVLQNQSFSGMNNQPEPLKVACSSCIFLSNAGSNVLVVRLVAVLFYHDADVGSVLLQVLDEVCQRFVHHTVCGGVRATGHHHSQPYTHKKTWNAI